jgi:hypothetical protein
MVPGQSEKPMSHHIVKAIPMPRSGLRYLLVIFPEGAAAAK